ncbi:hypothetical protein GCM10023335_19810 [Streptomyces siamensis]|uniref:Uncharacterized protein n=1 Tax=Streptomyces siamensis TaxID=1274986 RepID=A0ABP9IQU2_9ACTN
MPGRYPITNGMFAISRYPATCGVTFRYNRKWVTVSRTCAEPSPAAGPRRRPVGITWPDARTRRNTSPRWTPRTAPPTEVTPTHPARPTYRKGPPGRPDRPRPTTVPNRPSPTAPPGPGAR